LKQPWQTSRRFEFNLDFSSRGAPPTMRSSATMDEVLSKATENWYLKATEAKRLALIEDMI
jgi:hypothetical protein